MLVSCIKEQDNPAVGNGIEPVILSTEYSLDEDIIIDVYIGIGSENSEFPSDYKYQIAITNNTEEEFGGGEDLVVLLEIVSDPDGKYNYIIDEAGEVRYTYFEKLTLPSEIFLEASGFFYLGLLEINIEPDQSEQIAGMMKYKYSYVVVHRQVIISITQ